MNQLSTILLCLLFSSSAFSQFLDLRVELYYEDDGTVAGYPEGYSTYRIYAQMADSDDPFMSVVAVVGCVDIYLRCNNDIWNHELGSHDGGQLVSQFFDQDPSLEYDSYLTVGRSSNDDPGMTSFVSLFPPSVFQSSFDTTPLGPDLEIEDGFWGVLDPSQPNRLQVGEDNEVLLAQITTSNELSWNFNVQVGNGSWEDNDLYYPNVTENTCQGQESEWVLDTDSNLMGPQPVSIESSEIQVKIFPNPTSSELRLNINDGNLYWVQVTDSQGKTVMDLGRLNGNTTHSIDELDAGIYLVQIRDVKGNALVKKLLVQ